MKHLIIMFNSKLRTLAAPLIILTAVISYFTVTQYSAAIEENHFKNDFNSFRALPPAAYNQNENAQLAPVDVMLVGLKKRLEQQPDDVDGWLLLSKSHFYLGNQADAKAAYETAIILGYAGNWKPVSRDDTGGKNISLVQQAKPGIESRDESSGNKTSNGVTGLKLKIALNQSLKDKFPAASAVFVFARSVENQGPPLAVVRKTVADLPFEITLDDSHAMIPGRTISSVKNVIVGARISISGGAKRQAGDYERLSAPIPANLDKQLELKISDRI